MGFSREADWRGLPFPPPGDLPDPGVEPMSLMSPALAGGFLPLVPAGKPRDLCSSVKLEVEHCDVCVRFYL